MTILDKAKAILKEHVHGRPENNGGKQRCVICTGQEWPCDARVLAGAIVAGHIVLRGKEGEDESPVPDYAQQGVD